MRGLWFEETDGAKKKNKYAAVRRQKFLRNLQSGELFRRFYATIYSIGGEALVCH